METIMQTLEQQLLKYLQDLAPEWINAKAAAEDLGSSPVKVRAVEKAV